MKIKFRSFTFTPSKMLPHKQFMDFLTECNEGDFIFTEKNRIFHFVSDVDPEFYAGCMITLKDHKNSCSLKNQKLIVVRSTEKGEQLMDFNYFVIHKESYRVLYQDYHHSMNLNQFGLFLKQRHDMRVSEMIEQALESEEIRNETKRKKSIHRMKKDAGEFTICAEIKKEEFEKLAQQLESITNFEFSTYKIDAEERNTRPLSKYAKSQTQRTSFTKDAPVTGIIRAIKETFSLTQAHKGRLKGYNPEGVQQIINITENPDYIAEYDFDEVTLKIQNKEIADLKGNWIIQELMDKSREHNLDVLVQAA